MAKARVAVVGASGYTGAELVRLLLAHPRAEITCVCAHKRAGERLDDVFPSLRGLAPYVLEPFDALAVAGRADWAFTGLPHGESAACVEALRARGVRVVDLSADFRLRDRTVHEQWYGPHHAPERAAEAVYGLVELHRQQLANAKLIASPGCYPTAAILAIAPILRAGLCEREGIIVDAKSGVTGAGRNAAAHTHFPEVSEGLRAYAVTSHRHTPEIEQELSKITGKEVRVTFTPHLVPMNRGILATVYATPTRGTTLASLRDALYASWENEPFIVVGKSAPDTAHVRSSNRVHVGVWFDERAGRIVAMSAIDNLVKGASGQAIQAWNVAMGFAEDEGLRIVPMFP